MAFSRFAWRGRLPSIGLLSLAVLAVALLFTGGSSRADNALLLILRPVNVACLMAVLLAGAIDWNRIKVSLLFLGLFALTVALQLVPVPPQIWLSFGARAHFGDVALALGAEDRWLPMSVAPDYAWNSLLTLLVPLSALVAFAAMERAERKLVLGGVLAVVLASMFVGVMQMAGGTRAAFNWYTESTAGELSGIFANRNHQAALLATALPLLRAWAASPVSDARTGALRGRIAIGTGALILVYLLVLGSRAGFVLGLLGVLAAWLVKPTSGFRGFGARRRWMALVAVVGGSLALFLLVKLTGRDVALNRLMGTEEMTGELRFAAMPTMFRMLADSLPFGTGFGSFAPVFVSYEPDHLLKPTYFNNAHNDLLELAITGGVPAIAVLVGFLVWWGRRAYAAFFGSGSTNAQALPRAAALAILLLFIASLTDYPLRNPILAGLFALLCAWLAQRNQWTVRDSAGL